MPAIQMVERKFDCWLVDVSKGRFAGQYHPTFPVHRRPIIVSIRSGGMQIVCIDDGEVASSPFFEALEVPEQVAVSVARSVIERFLKAM